MIDQEKYTQDFQAGFHKGYLSCKKDFVEKTVWWLRLIGLVILLAVAVYLTIF